MTRSIDPDVKALLQEPESIDALLAFATIRHPTLPDPIRVVSDVLDYVLAGETYLGLPFEFNLLSDDEGPAKTQIVVQNVDRRIGRAVLALPDRATISLEVRSSADFDLNQNPRVEIPGGAPIYAFENFDLIEVTCTAADLSGTVMLRDFSQEPFPGLRGTQSRLPGLFR